MRLDLRQSAFMIINEQATRVMAWRFYFAERENVLVQDGGVRWNSIYAMLTLALQLRSTDERFHRRDAAPSDGHTDGTWSQLDWITSDNWNIARQ